MSNQDCELELEAGLERERSSNGLAATLCVLGLECSHGL